MNKNYYKSFCVPALESIGGNVYCFYCGNKAKSYERNYDEDVYYCTCRGSELEKELRDMVRSTDKAIKNIRFEEEIKELKTKYKIED